jgi:hypothetical protein
MLTFLLLSVAHIISLLKNYPKSVKKTVQHCLDSSISTYSRIFNENEAPVNMSSTIDKEDPVVGYKCKDNVNGAISKINITQDTCNI